MESKEALRRNAIRQIPDDTEVTTGAIAELPSVFRPYVVRILDEGKIPSHRVGTHRCVLFKDVMTYQNEHLRARGVIPDQMAAIDQELGLA